MNDLKHFHNYDVVNRKSPAKFWKAMSHCQWLSDCHHYRRRYITNHENYVYSNFKEQKSLWEKNKYQVGCQLVACLRIHVEGNLIWLCLFLSHKRRTQQPAYQILSPVKDNWLIIYDTLPFYSKIWKIFWEKIWKIGNHICGYRCQNLLLNRGT